MPGPYTLLSVAAVVLGGVSLAGGRGGVVGPIVAVVDPPADPHRHDVPRRRHQPRRRRPGRDPHRRGHGRQPRPAPAERGHERGDRQRRAPAEPVADRGRLARACSATGRSIPLLGPARLLLVIAASSSGRASSAPTGSASSLRAAVPLAILAGCQTLTMLTGGIDLSVGAVASMAGFVVATLVGRPGPRGRDPRRRSIAAALVGLVNGIGVGVFRVHPLIMTLGMGLVVLGLANVWQLVDGPDRRRRAARAALARARTGCSRSCPYSLLVFVPLAVADPARPAADRLRPAALRDRRQPDRGAPVGRAGVAGPGRPVHHLGAARRRSPGS